MSLKAQPSSSKAREAIERIAFQLGRQVDLIELYDELAAECDDMGAFDYHFSIGRIAETHLNDPILAERAYRKALESGADTTRCFEALERTLEKQGRHGAVLDLLRERFDLEVSGRDIDDGSDYSTSDLESRESQHIPLLLRMGTASQRMGRFSDALDAFEDVLNMSSANEQALASVESMIDHDQVWDRVQSILEPIYRQKSDVAKWVWLLQRVWIRQTTPRARAQALLKIADMQKTQLEQQDEAFATLTLAIHQDGTYETAALEFFGLAETLGRLNVAVTTAEEVLSTINNWAPYRFLTQSAASTAHEQLSDSGRAVRLYQRLLENLPSDAETCDRLAKIYVEAERFSDLVDLRWFEVDASFDQARNRKLVHEIIVTCRDQLGDVRGQIKGWRWLLADNPSDDEALSAIEGLYEDDQSWEDYLSFLNELFASANSPDQRCFFALKLADLKLHLFGSSAATDTYKTALKFDPCNEQALSSLYQIYAASAQWVELERILLIRARIAPPDRAIMFWLELASLAERELDAPEKAAEYLAEVIRIDPDHESGIEQLERLLGTLGQWEQLAAHRARRVSRLREIGNQHAANCNQIAHARLLSDRLNRSDEAIAALENIVRSKHAPVEAMLELLRLYEQRERWNQSAVLLKQLNGRRLDKTAKAELAFRRGRIALLSSKAPAAAKQYFEEACRLNPKHAEATEALCSVFEAEARWHDSAILRERLLKTDPNGERATHHLTRLSELYLDPLDQPQRALDCLRRAAELDDSNYDIKARLLRVHVRLDDLKGAKSLLLTLVTSQQATDRAENAYYQYLLGAIAELDNNLETAGRHYREAHRLDGSCETYMVALGKLSIRQDKWEDAKIAFRSLLLQLKPSSPTTRSEVLYYLGFASMKLGETAKARMFFARGLEADPNDGRLRMALNALDVE